MPHHVFSNKDGDKLSSVVHRNGMPDHLRNNGRPPGPAFDDDPLIGFIQVLDLLEKMIVQKRSLFY